MKIVNSASEDIDLLGRIQELEYRLNNGEGAEYVGSYAPSNSLVEQRLSTIENKIKKLYNEIEKANISGFEESVNSKINILEDVVSKYICQHRPPNKQITTYLFGYEVDNPSSDYLQYRVFNEPYSGTVNETYYTKNLKFAKSFFRENVYIKMVSAFAKISIQ